MEEQKRLPTRVDLEEFTEAITRGAMRALAAQKSEVQTQGTTVASSVLVNPIIRLGIWLEVTQGGFGGPGGPIGPVGPEGPVA